MTDMTPKKRQMMQEMIERAAKDQEKQIDWIKNLREQRIAAQKQQSMEKNELA